MAKKIGTFIGYAIVVGAGLLVISLIVLSLSIVWSYIRMLW